jgi:TRAP-type transport system periplasmic protein
MKKRISLFFVALISLTLLIAGCGNSSAGTGDGESKGGSDKGNNAEYKWIGGTAVSPNDPIAKALDYFGERVNELSDGQIVVESHHGGTLGTEPEMIESVITGSTQLAVIGHTMVSGWYKPADFWIFPFLFNSEEHKNKAWLEIKEDYSNEVAQEVGVRPIANVVRGPRMLSSNKVVKTPEDMKGLKIRTPETQMWVEAFKRFGASPTGLAFPEVYQSLQTGVIDGQENPMSLSYNSGFFEVNTHLAKLEHMMQDNTIIINEELYQGLPSELKEAVIQASEETEKFVQEALAKESKEIEEKLIEMGIEINEVDKEAFKATVEGMEDDFPHTKKWIERVRAVE